MNEEALKLADDLANAYTSKHLWQFEEAARHIRELSEQVKQLQDKVNQLERNKP